MLQIHKQNQEVLIPGLKKIGVPFFHDKNLETTLNKLWVTLTFQFDL